MPLHFHPQNDSPGPFFFIGIFPFVSSSNSQSLRGPKDVTPFISAHDDGEQVVSPVQDERAYMKYDGKKVVTLGDSYSSGTGIHNKGSEYDEEGGGDVAGYKLTARSDDECWREKHTTPGPKYASYNGKTSIFLACKGAEVSHVINQINYLNSLYQTDAANKWAGSLILLTAGGNDIRTKRGEDWPDLLKRCILEVNPFKGCDDHDKNQVSESTWDSIESKLNSFYSKLAREASSATVRILGYPRLMQRDPGCSSVTGLGRDEADWVDDQVDVLNDRIQGAVNSVKTSYPNFDISYVSVINYITVGACGPKSTREVNDKVLDGLKTSDSSFHPTQLGYDAYYRALVDNIMGYDVKTN